MAGLGFTELIRVIACRIARRIVGLVRVRTRLEQQAHRGDLTLLDRNDEGRLAHLVGAVDLCAHVDEPLDGIVETHAGRDDQRRIAALAGQVRIRTLVEQETHPFGIAARERDDQRAIAIVATRIDEAGGVIGEELHRLAAVAALHRLEEVEPLIAGAHLRGRRRGDGQQRRSC